MEQFRVLVNVHYIYKLLETSLKFNDGFNLFF